MSKSVDFTQSDGSRAILRLFHTAYGGGRLASRFGGKHFARSFATSGLLSRLFGASHLRKKEKERERERERVARKKGLNNDKMKPCRHGMHTLIKKEKKRTVSLK